MYRFSAFLDASASVSKIRNILSQNKIEYKNVLYEIECMVFLLVKKVGVPLVVLDDRKIILNRKCPVAVAVSQCYFFLIWAPTHRDRDRTVTSLNYNFNLKKKTHAFHEISVLVSSLVKLKISNG